VSWIDRQYPAAVGRYTIKSQPDGEYNCIAFAADDQTMWWSHENGYKWPAARTSDIGSLVAVFAGLGYQQCDTSDAEPGYERVVLYEKNGEWTHAARQVPSGAWVSKLGPDEDIEHDDPYCLCGNAYGNVHCIMRRKI
jgi:hypothetical protein